MFTFLALLPARSSETKKKHKEQLCSVPLINKMPTLSTDNFFRRIYLFWLFWSKETISISLETGIVLYKL